MRQADMPRAEENWTTESTVPDPDPLPIIPGWSVLIRPVAIKERTKGGIILTDQYREDVKYLTTVGRVLALGDFAYSHQDFWKPEVVSLDEEFLDRDAMKVESFGVDGLHLAYIKRPWCKVGDHVCYGKFAGTKFIYKGVKLLLLEDRLVDMVVPDPASIDPQYNISQG